MSDNITKGEVAIFAVAVHEAVKSVDPDAPYGHPGGC